MDRWRYAPLTNLFSDITKPFHKSACGCENVEHFGTWFGFDPCSVDPYRKYLRSNTPCDEVRSQAPTALLSKIPISTIDLPLYQVCISLFCNPWALAWVSKILLRSLNPLEAFPRLTILRMIYCSAVSQTGTTSHKYIYPQDAVLEYQPLNIYLLLREVPAPMK